MLICTLVVTSSVVMRCHSWWTLNFRAPFWAESYYLTIFGKISMYRQHLFIDPLYFDAILLSCFTAFVL